MGTAQSWEHTVIDDCPRLENAVLQTNEKLFDCCVGEHGRPYETTFANEEDIVIRSSNRGINLRASQPRFQYN